MKGLISAAVAVLALTVLPLAAASPGSGSHAKGSSPYATLPLSFVPNAGQFDKRVKFSAQAGGASFFFTSREAVLTLAKKSKGVVLRLGFVHANAAPAIDASTLLSGKVSYLIGNDRARWHRGLPTYGQIVYRNLWPGIDMRFGSAPGRLKYEFLVQPGARVQDIALAYRGVRRLSVDGTGGLVVHTAVGAVNDTAPVSYQLIHGKRVAIASRFALAGSNRYGFTVGKNYDPSRPLVIDPGLVYSTYLGGTDDDQGHGVAVDEKGQAYISGSTSSTDFPTTAGAYDRSYNGPLPALPGYGGDTFITKLNSSGTALVYSTYLGGTGGEPFFSAASIAIDSYGQAYIGGSTWSDDFPTTPGAWDRTLGGEVDAFVTKLNRNGSGLVYSTYLGGTGWDGANGDSSIVLDQSGAAYLTGLTQSLDFPATPGAFQSAYNGGFYDGFVTKLNSAGSALVYSTYLGGEDSELGMGITVDRSGYAYVTGWTSSLFFPITPGAYQTVNRGITDGFVTKLNRQGTAPVYSTYVGGTSDETSSAIAIDSSGRAYITGLTSSTDYPVTPGAYQSTNAGSYDAFVTRLNSSGSALSYSTYIGGATVDAAWNIAVDSAGQAHIVGATDSSNYPTTPNAFQPAYKGGFDALVTKLNSSGTGLVYSTYFGGATDDTGLGIALDWAGNVYITGGTNSIDLPTTPGAYDRIYNGGVYPGDAFVAKLDVGARRGEQCDRNSESDQAEHDRYQQINRDRQAKLMAPLTLSTSSSNAARKHSCDDHERGHTGERGDDGKSAADRQHDAGGVFLVSAENEGIALSPVASEAFGQITGDLLADPTAVANELNPAFKQVGIGAAYIDGVMILTEDYTG